MALHRRFDARGVLLGVELGGMNADHHYRVVRVPLFEVPEDGQDVHAVDAAVGPEIEDDDVAAQLADRDGAIHVQPCGRRGQVGGVDAFRHSSSMARNEPRRKAERRAGPGKDIPARSSRGRRGR